MSIVIVYQQSLSYLLLVPLNAQPRKNQCTPLYDKTKHVMHELKSRSTYVHDQNMKKNGWRKVRKNLLHQLWWWMTKWKCEQVMDEKRSQASTPQLPMTRTRARDVLEFEKLSRDLLTYEPRSVISSKTFLPPAPGSTENLKYV